MEIQELLRHTSAISKKYEQIAEITGENFNIFKILKVETSEVGTHSAFLAELLNPKGKHGQKDAFLKAFVQILKIEGFESSQNIDADVKVEEVSEYGRIDIVIKPKNGGCVIVIENKIYASDQYNQLVRYKKKYPSCHLLYLTLDGEKPDPNSTRDKLTDQDLIVNQDFFIISYKEDILKWLEICRKESTNFPILRETITQYINLRPPCLSQFDLRVF